MEKIEDFGLIKAKPIIWIIAIASLMFGILNPIGPGIPYFIMALFGLFILWVMEKSKAGYQPTKTVAAIVLFFMVFIFAGTFFYYEIIPRSLGYQIEPSCPGCSTIFQFGSTYQAKYYPDMPVPGTGMMFSVDYCKSDCSLCTSCVISAKVVENGAETYLKRNETLVDKDTITFNYPGRTVFVEVVDRNRHYNFTVPRPGPIESIIIEANQNQLFLFAMIILSFLGGFSVLASLIYKFVLKRPILFKKKEPPPQGVF